MPRYVYECGTCEARVEEDAKMDDPPKVECGCGGKLRRVPQRTTAVLRGTGWYRDGYK